MRKLEENFKQSGGKWQEFRIGDLFEKIKTKKLEFKAQDLKNRRDEIYNLPALTAGVENQGLAYYVPRENATILKNVISVSANGANTGVMFYQPNDFTVLQDSYAIKFRYKELSNSQYLFFVAALQKSIRFQFDWSNKAGWEKIKNRFISLPVLTNGEIAFEYMESYIKELEAERLEELEAYLLTTGLKDYKLTEQEKVILQDFAKLQNENSKRGGAFSSLEDYLLYGGSLLDSKKQNFITHALSCLTQRALKSLDTSKWQEFPFYEIFIYERGKRYKKADHTSGKIPYISSSAFNNGIDNYVSPPSYMKIYTNKLTLANSGSVGTCFYHPYSFVASDHCMVIWLKDKEMNTHIALFLLPIFEKLKDKHDFGREINHDRLMQEKFLLPIDSKGNPDFAFMESFIKEIEKEHFLSLIEYYHKEMSAYNEVLETNGGGIKL
ncbi:restriction endonuclease subunit S [uncultured Campylobacter sp.]|uniref:restriction endonuclease subunit S n=1 Tax=uncultured Campylobacter sp. TaxID=218934 RepID=UPI00261CA945|nr:restriction endonuclease subunit S [uncultured Campylobacter sp.]